LEATNWNLAAHFNPANLLDEEIQNALKRHPVKWIFGIERDGFALLFCGGVLGIDTKKDTARTARGYDAVMLSLALHVAIMGSTPAAYYSQKTSLPLPAKVAPFRAGESASIELYEEASLSALADNSLLDSSGELRTATVSGNDIGTKYWAHDIGPKAREGVFSLVTDPRFMSMRSDMETVTFPWPIKTQANELVGPRSRGFVYRISYRLITREVRLSKNLPGVTTSRLEQKEWIKYVSRVVPYGMAWNPLSNELTKTDES
jgi:hypothetical protein